MTQEYPKNFNEFMEDIANHYLYDPTGEPIILKAIIEYLKDETNTIDGTSLIAYLDFLREYHIYNDEYNNQTLDEYTIAELLLNRVANIEINDKNDVLGYKVLMNAFDTQNEDIMMLLLNKIIENNKDIINQKDKDGDTLLMIAIRKRAPTIVVERLIKDGADVNEKNNNGDTPLMIAIEYNQTIAKMLIENNKEIINEKDKDGNTPLMLAIMDKNISKKDGNTQLMHVYIDENLKSYRHYVKETIVKMLDNGANVNETNNNGDTPLMLAIMNNNLELPEILFKNGAAYNSKNKKGKNVLMYACEYGNAFVVEKVIGIYNTFGLNYTDSDGNTALMFAIENNKHIDIMLNDRRLEKKEEGVVDLNSYQVDIVIDLKKNYDSITSLLIKNGADLNKTNNKGNTALLISIMRRNIYIATLLIKNGADITINKDKISKSIEKIKDPLKQKFKKIVDNRSLLQKGSDIFKRGSDIFKRGSGYKKSKKNKKFKRRTHKIKMSK